MRSALNLIGALLVVAGVFWALQGAGIIMWPAESFMLAQKDWIAYGSLTALFGLVLIGVARRKRR
ncbi:hypothetical protein [Qipengyuania sp.]|uniref:hypothetical protein n=1 Tax=Qipengyuania sp. TaxID=2004515 RepID=UPI0035C7DD49